METQQARVAAVRAALSAVETRTGADRKATEGGGFPVAPALRDLLPQGLRRGQVTTVEGSTSLMLALASQASREGAWMAMIGMPSVGVLAAARRGVDLSRLALIPHPGLQAPATLGACLDGMDLVMVGRGVALSDADRRRLAARAKERGCAVVAQGSWSGAHVVLAAERSRWRGLGAGEGRLRERDVAVMVSGRSTGAARRVIVTLDEDLHSLDPRPGFLGAIVEGRSLGSGAA